MEAPSIGTAVAQLRAFNRFYTRRIGLLDDHLSASPFTLAQARVFYELAHGTADTAAELCRLLGMDRAQASRILGRFRAAGLVTEEACEMHGRRRLLTLTEAGRTAFAQLERGTVEQMEKVLEPLDASRRAKLASAMGEVRECLAGGDAASSRGFALRSPKPGDLGWITHRQAVLYAREHGWDWTYEGLVASILGRFVENFDPAREQAWVAERDGAIVGSVFLVRGEAPESAKLRLFYVEPSARGLGIGAALVRACIGRARQAGYARLTLWTNDVLVSARRIYIAAGFRLVSEEKHHSFGADLVGQFWELDLAAPPAAG